MPNNHQEILESKEFKKLVYKRWVVSLLLTGLMLSVYFGYLLTIAFNKPVLSHQIDKNVTLGLPIGIGIILLAWLLTGIYVYWANSDYDKSVTEIKNKITI